MIIELYAEHAGHILSGRGWPRPGARLVARPPKENAKAWANRRARIVLLSQFGHELRRPAVDFLRDGIYELRAKQGHVQYRILYFFHGRNVAVLSHSLTKEDSIPLVEIERALKRKRQFEQNPEKHTYAED